MRDDTSGQVARFDGYSGSSGASTNVSFTMRAARGTFAAPSALQSGDLLLTFGARGYGATGFSAQNKARIQFKAAENWTDTAQGSSVTLGATPLGSTTLVDVLTATAARVSIAAPLNLKSYTVATLPAGSAGDRAFVTDANATTFASIVAGGGSNGVPVYHDGTNWRIG